MTRRGLVLAADGFGQWELIEPKRALEAAGIETVVTRPEHPPALSLSRWRGRRYSPTRAPRAKAQCQTADQLALGPLTQAVGS